MRRPSPTVTIGPMAARRDSLQAPSEPPTFRTATPADVPALEALIESAYRGDESRKGWTTEADLLSGHRLGPGALATIVAAPSERMLVAERRGELAGCCQLAQRPGATAYFGMLAVRPVGQGSGIGRALVGEAERIGREEWSARLMTLQVISVRHELIAWYRRLGYHPTGERLPFRYDDPWDRPIRPGLEFMVLAKLL